MKQRTRARAWCLAMTAALAAAAAGGCVGQLGGETDDADLPGAGPGGSVDEDGGTGGEGSGEADQPICEGETPDTEPVVVRMLNRREYRNTLRDLLGVEVALDELPADPVVGFDNRAESLVASSALVEKQLAIAERVSEEVDASALLPCDGCVEEMVVELGRRAYRRPLEAQEVDALMGIHDRALEAGREPDHAIRLLLQGMLQSPQFLYRVERSVSGVGGVAPVEPYELASRLSYFLWASMPDDELLAAAASGALSTPKGVETEARRMLDDPRARAMTTAFHALWLKLDRLPSTTKDPALYPGYEELAPRFAEETERFADGVFWGDAGAEAYLVSSTTFVDATLAAHYGIEAPPGDAMAPVDGGAQRFGLLTQGSILSTFSNTDRTSPTRRGAFVRAQLLCQEPPPPPEDIPPLPSSSGEGDTVRERLAEHTENPVCSSCHMLLDPIGFGLENYDTVGAWRDEDAGAPVDASGSIVGLGDEDREFVGARELAEELVASDELYACVATQWFRFAAGREAGPRDACSTARIERAFRDAGDRMPDLLVAVAVSDAFRWKSTEVSP